MTHPTKAIYRWLIQDSVRVGNTSSNPTNQPVYTEQDHLSTFPQIEAIDYYTTHTISSIRITPYPAGHVLGAAMFLIEIAGLNIFFTGDYSREQDRHLVSAEVPRGVKIDVLITESTYGVASHVPRLEREQALMKSITGILNRGGRVLLPVFALGRAQELLLILDEYWAKHPEFQKVPIYYASNLARKCMLVYQTYIGAMNDNIKRLFKERMAEAEATGDGAGKGGPWDFKFIRSLKSLDRFEDVGSAVSCVRRWGRRRGHGGRCSTARAVLKVRWARVTSAGGVRVVWVVWRVPIHDGREVRLLAGSRLETLVGGRRIGGRRHARASRTVARRRDRVWGAGLGLVVGLTAERPGASSGWALLRSGRHALERGAG